MASRNRVQNEALMSKLLSRCLLLAEQQSIQVSGEFVDNVRTELAAALDRGSLDEKQLKVIVSRCGVKRAKSTNPLPPVQPSQKSQIVTSAAAPLRPASEPPSISASKELLLSTTRRERQMLADRDWIDAANKDREDGARSRIQDKIARHDLHDSQKRALDSQMREHEMAAEAERQRRRKAQDDMTDTINFVKNEVRREKMEALDKARREKEFRERQARDLETLRERQRTEEHNDQVRHMTMIQQELQRQRDLEAATKEREKNEWLQVLRENDERLAEKARRKEFTRAEDRRFQREFEENQDRVERERAIAKAKKEARAATFQQMANVVAQMHLKKVQNVDNKIEAEYEEQQRRAMEDEQNRKERAKQRILQTHSVLDMQRAQKEAEKKAEQEAARRTAEALAEQAREAARQEHARKMAARAEAARMKEFLTTQVQLQHFRETRPLETSITRPESRARTMYSPSRASPSPSQF